MIDFDTVLKTPFGDPLQDMVAPPTADAPARYAPLTLAQLAVNAALAAPADGKTLSVAEHVDRFSLAQKVAGGGRIALSAEHVALIKDAVARNYPSLIAGQALLLLDPAAAG
jgi:hypothetical protein